MMCTMLSMADEHPLVKTRLLLTFPRTIVLSMGFHPPYASLCGLGLGEFPKQPRHVKQFIQPIIAVFGLWPALFLCRRNQRLKQHHC